jgi:hypothetical protein
LAGFKKPFPEFLNHLGEAHRSGWCDGSSRRAELLQFRLLRLGLLQDGDIGLEVVFLRAERVQTRATAVHVND